jgi:DNA-directed RNA polymerase sigma subunit (sigma70/sigma32)
MRYNRQIEEWAKHRAQVMAHYEQTKSYAKTGEAFGLTRERVRQIVMKETGRAKRP